MDSDDYFDEELDSAIIHEFDAIEAAHTSPQKSYRTTTAKLAVPATRPSPSRSVIEILDSDPFDAFDFDVADLHDIQENQHDDPRPTPGQPVAGPSKAPFRRTASKATLQTTLFGDVIPADPSKGKGSKPQSKGPMERSTSSRNLFGEHTRKTKHWDHTAFSKTGYKQTAADRAKRKGKNRISFDDEDDESEEEVVEFEQFPAPFVPVG